LRVKVMFFGPMKGLLGVEDEVIEFENRKTTTVRDLIEKIASIHGDEIKSLLIHGGSSNRSVNIFVNGRHILEQGDLEAEIRDEDEVNIILVSQAAGG